jgi:hypothetical protein
LAEYGPQKRSEKLRKVRKSQEKLKNTQEMSKNGRLLAAKNSGN